MKSLYQFRLPESFHPGEFLQSPWLLRLADDSRYFISLILTKMSRGDVDNYGNVRLMAKHLRSIMSYHHYNHVVDALLGGGAVERVPYHVGQRSFGYRLGERFRGDKHVRIPATDTRLIDRLQRFHEESERKRQSRMKPVHFALEQHQRRLSIDGNLGRDILATLPPESNPFDVQGILIKDIERREFHVNVGRYGRFTNNITSMKREIRPSLRHRLDPLQSVDISCCQPALIGKAARNKASEEEEQAEKRKGNNNRHVSIYDAQNLPHFGGDLDLYCELVQTGQFYDFMLTILRNEMCPNYTRDDLKKRFLTDVVAKRKANRYGSEYPSDVEDTFRRLFPSVYRFIRNINHDGWQHEALIRRLQQEESKLVIETVAADLVVRRPDVFVLTLHDAIFTTARSIPIVVGAFEAAFDWIGFPMSLKVAE